MLNHYRHSVYGGVALRNLRFAHGYIRNLGTVKLFREKCGFAMNRTDIFRLKAEFICAICVISITVMLANHLKQDLIAVEIDL